MNSRNRFALAGIVVVVLIALQGFAAFSTDGEPAASETETTAVANAVDLPADASARVVAAVLADSFREVPPPDNLPIRVTHAPADTIFGAPDPQDAPVEATLEAAAEPATTTTTDPPPPPTTTTTAPPQTTTTTTTTTAPPASTTTTTTVPATTTTTAGEVTGGSRDVEEWRWLVDVYFPADLVGEALVVMNCESRGDPHAENPRSGAAGLFQFLPSTWRWASEGSGWAGTSPFDAEANVAVAAWLAQASQDGGHSGGAWGHWSCKP